jgi:hypothetical protein
MNRRNFIRCTALAAAAAPLAPILGAESAPAVKLRRVNIVRGNLFYPNQPFSEIRAGDTVTILAEGDHSHGKMFRAEENANIGENGLYGFIAREVKFTGT